MDKSKRFLAIMGVVCGAELLIAVAIGGASLSIFFGTEGLLVAGIMLLFVLLYVAKKVKVARQSS